MTRSKSWPPAWRNQRIVLYHGTDQSSAQRIATDGVDVFAGRHEVDFGQGFYTTTVASQAGEWASNKANKKNKQPAVVRLTLERLAVRDLRTLSFILGDEDNEDYWSFVAHCRRGQQIAPITSEYYDVVYGPVASTWWADKYGIKPGLDQISFHGDRAQALLRDSRFCELEVVR